MRLLFIPDPVLHMPGLDYRGLGVGHFPGDGLFFVLFPHILTSWAIICQLQIFHARQKSSRRGQRPRQPARFPSTGKLRGVEDAAPYDKKRVAK